MSRQVAHPRVSWHRCITLQSYNNGASVFERRSVRGSPSRQSSLSHLASVSAFSRSWSVIGMIAPLRRRIVNPGLRLLRSAREPACGVRSPSSFDAQVRSLLCETGGEAALRLRFMLRLFLSCSDQTITASPLYSLSCRSTRRRKRAPYIKRDTQESSLGDTL